MWSLKTSSFYLTGSRHLRPIRSRLFESEQVQHGANTIPTLFKFHSILCCCLCCFFQCLLPPAQEWTASQTGTKNNNELPWFLFEVTVMTLRGFLFVLQWFQRQKKNHHHVISLFTFHFQLTFTVKYSSALLDFQASPENMHYPGSLTTDLDTVKDSVFGETESV